MRNVYHVARRELGAFFVSPIAYVVTAIYLAVTGGLFGFILYYSREATLRYVLMHGVSLLFLVLITQVLTMRLLAEEQRLGTLELLLTAPLRDWEVVLGKFLASLSVFLVMVLLTSTFVIVLLRVGEPDMGVILSGYLGYILLGTSMLAIGVFASSLTQNQIVAAVVGMGITLILWISGALGEFVGGAMESIVTFLPIFDHYQDFARGIIDTRDILYYLSVTVLFLFMSVRVVEWRRWR